MNKPFTIRVNDLQEEITQSLNNAKLPCYVLRNVLKELIKAIDDADGEEITNYFRKLKEEKDNGNLQEDKEN